MRRTTCARLLAVPLVCSALAALPAHAADRAMTLRTYSVYPQAGSETTLVGTLADSPAGSAVSLQELRSGQWSTLGRVSTASDGSFAWSFTPSTSGNKSFRGVAEAISGAPAVTSPTFTMAVAPMPKTRFDRADVPTVTGTPVVGSVLTATTGTWSPSATVYRQWARDGVLLPAYQSSYQVTAADVGKRITFVSAAALSGSWTARESRPGAPVRTGTFVTRPPSISGPGEMGSTLTARFAGWSPEPSAKTYRWQRNGVPIDGATAPTYVVTSDDAGSDLSVAVRGELAGYEPAVATSANIAVAGAPSGSPRVFGDLMRPYSTDAVASDVSYEALQTFPSWGRLALTRWDKEGAFTHSLPPRPMGTLYTAQTGTESRYAPGGCEYVATNALYKSADVTFEFTGTRFVIEYRAYANSDAMVWIDGKPLALAPIIGRDSATGRTSTRQFIAITLGGFRTVNVRFAGPYIFTGVYAPTSDNALVVAASRAFTLAVLGDSFYESAVPGVPLSQSGAPTLATLTGFRVRNLSEGGTGYLNDAGRRGPVGYQTSVYGSPERIAAINAPPIDALMLFGGYNDLPPRTAEQHREAVDKLLDAFEETRPDLPVVIVGIQGMARSVTPTYKPHFSALTANFAAMQERHPNVVGFIDPFTDPWLTGTGTVANRKGDGNQDDYMSADGYHLTGPGNAYYQGRLAQELAKLPIAKAP